MEQASITAKEINETSDLDWPTLEMILFLTQKSVSDLKEIRQKHNFYQSAYGNCVQSSQGSQIKQVTEQASNAYALKAILEEMHMSQAEKEKNHQ